MTKDKPILLVTSIILATNCARLETLQETSLLLAKDQKQTIEP